MSVWVCEDLCASLRSLACGCLAYSVSVNVYESISVSFSVSCSLALGGVRKLESQEKSERINALHFCEFLSESVARSRLASFKSFQLSLRELLRDLLKKQKAEQKKQ